jgi:hypothetical protein
LPKQMESRMTNELKLYRQPDENNEKQSKFFFENQNSARRIE